MAIWALICKFVNGSADTFIIDYSKSQMGWLFSSYFVIYFFFKVHPKASIDKLIYYIIAAIFIQCVITVAMNLDEGIYDFFTSLQKSDDVGDKKREMTEGKRLLGYGVAFFGMGIACGTALILLVYIFMTKKMNLIRTLFVAFLYCSIFFVGLLSARTTMVGAAASVILMIFLFFYGASNKGGQLFSFIIMSVLLFTFGVTLSYVYFPEFADWAFEAFLNYQETGEFRTVSSDGLYVMFYFPRTIREWIFGIGIGSYWGTDVGYTRLLFWFGIFGTILFFYYQIILMRISFTNNTLLNVTILMLFGYNLALNIKGFSELNMFMYLISGYFLYYKYFIYTPYLYRLGKFNQTKLRYAVQT